MLEREIDSAISLAKQYAPYLKESLSLFPECPQRLKSVGIERYFDDLSKALPTEIQVLSDEMELLRQYKRHAHLAIALADIAQIWTWEEVTLALTQLADIAMARLMRACAIDHNIEGTQDNPVPGLFVLAMGKYGAGELNYSSDIDFCVFYDPDIIVLPNMARAERSLIRFIKSLIAGFEQMTIEGYIFRTDLRLRPDPRSNAVAVSTQTAERYYETWGQNWERAAMIKARVCGGDKTLGQGFIDTVLKPFIWRRSLDYAAIDDIHSIKRQINAAKTGVKISAAGHHLKLGLGGIREIEFYAQTQQLILGGRHPQLRQIRTVDALKALTDFKVIKPSTCDDLIEDYAFLRKCEHAAQMIDDAQTHISPIDDNERLALASLVGYDDIKSFDVALITCLNRVHDHYTHLFPDAENLSLPQGPLGFTGVEPSPATLKTLEALGFNESEAVWQTMAAWLGGRIAATRSERARELLTRLAPKLISICAQTGAPDKAFRVYKLFFERIQTGVTVLSMFVQETDRLSAIITLMMRSPRIADMMTSNASILDAMSDIEFLQIKMDDIGADYAQAVQEGADFEDHMNIMRRCLHEDQFRVNAAALSGLLSIEDVPKVLTRMADRVVQTMLPCALTETQRVIGQVEGDFAVLALGKAGGGELSLSSDLDVMVIYEPALGNENPNVHRQFTKLTQRFVSAISATTGEGYLYELDMALRPSGRSGPVAVSREAFNKYYFERAWTWEFMALSRARVMAASCPEFALSVRVDVQSALSSEREDLNFNSDICDMLKRLHSEKPSRGGWDVKQSVGGLRDVEFIAQKFYLQSLTKTDHLKLPTTLAMLARLHDLKKLTTHEFDRLKTATRFYHDVTQALTLTRGDLSGELNVAEEEHFAAVLGQDVSALSSLRDTFYEDVSGLTKKYI